MRRRWQHLGDSEGEKKKGLGVRARPQRRGEIPSEPAASSGPAGRVLPPACELLNLDGKETLLAWPQRQMRVHCELGGVGSSAGQVLPPACTVLSCGSPESHSRCRLNRRGAFGFEHESCSDTVPARFLLKGNSEYWNSAREGSASGGEPQRLVVLGLTWGSV